MRIARLRTSAEAMNVIDNQHTTRRGDEMKQMLPHSQKEPTLPTPS